MTPEERELVNGLCKRIAEEKDILFFPQLVEQLDEILSRKEKRLAIAGAKHTKPDINSKQPTTQGTVPFGSEAAERKLALFQKPKKP